jgi:hypothetical protein
MKSGNRSDKRLAMQLATPLQLQQGNGNRPATKGDGTAESPPALLD